MTKLGRNALASGLFIMGLRCMAITKLKIQLKWNITILTTTWSKTASNKFKIAPMITNIQLGTLFSTTQHPVMKNSACAKK